MQERTDRARHSFYMLQIKRSVLGGSEGGSNGRIIGGESNNLSQLHQMDAATNCSPTTVFGSIRNLRPNGSNPKISQQMFTRLQFQTENQFFVIAAPTISYQ